MASVPPPKDMQSAGTANYNLQHGYYDGIHSGLEHTTIPSNQQSFQHEIPYTSNDHQQRSYRQPPPGYQETNGNNGFEILQGPKTPYPHGQTTPILQGQTTPNLQGQTVPNLQGQWTAYHLQGPPMPNLQGSRMPNLQGPTMPNLQGQMMPHRMSNLQGQRMPYPQAQPMKNLQGQMTPIIQGQMTAYQQDHTTPNQQGQMTSYQQDQMTAYQQGQMTSYQQDQMTAYQQGQTTSYLLGQTTSNLHGRASEQGQCTHNFFGTQQQCNNYPNMLPSYQASYGEQPNYPPHPPPSATNQIQPRNDYMTPYNTENFDLYSNVQPSQLPQPSPNASAQFRSSISGSYGANSNSDNIEQVFNRDAHYSGNDQQWPMNLPNNIPNNHLQPSTSSRYELSGSQFNPTDFDLHSQYPVARTGDSEVPSLYDMPPPSEESNANYFWKDENLNITGMAQVSAQRDKDRQTKVKRAAILQENEDSKKYYYKEQFEQSVTLSENLSLDTSVSTATKSEVFNLNSANPHHRTESQIVARTDLNAGGTRWNLSSWAMNINHSNLPPQQVLELPTPPSYPMGIPKTLAIAAAQKQANDARKELKSTQERRKHAENAISDFVKKEREKKQPRQKMSGPLRELYIKHEYVGRQTRSVRHLLNATDECIEAELLKLELTEAKQKEISASEKAKDAVRRLQAEINAETAKNSTANPTVNYENGKIESQSSHEKGGTTRGRGGKSATVTEPSVTCMHQRDYPSTIQQHPEPVQPPPSSIPDTHKNQPPEPVKPPPISIPYTHKNQPPPTLRQHPEPVQPPPSSIPYTHKNQPPPTMRQHPEPVQPPPSSIPYTHKNQPPLTMRQHPEPVQPPTSSIPYTHKNQPPPTMRQHPEPVQPPPSSIPYTHKNQPPPTMQQYPGPGQLPPQSTFPYIPTNQPPPPMRQHPAPVQPPPRSTFPYFPTNQPPPTMRQHPEPVQPLPSSIPYTHKNQPPPTMRQYPGPVQPPSRSTFPYIPTNQPPPPMQQHSAPVQPSPRPSGSYVPENQPMRRPDPPGYHESVGIPRPSVSTAPPDQYSTHLGVDPSVQNTAGRYEDATPKKRGKRKSHSCCGTSPPRKTSRTEGHSKRYPRASTSRQVTLLSRPKKAYECVDDLFYTIPIIPNGVFQRCMEDVLSTGKDRKNTEEKPSVPQAFTSAQASHKAAEAVPIAQYKIPVVSSTSYSSVGAASGSMPPRAVSSIRNASTVTTPTLVGIARGSMPPRAVSSIRTTPTVTTPTPVGIARGSMPPRAVSSIRTASTVTTPTLVGTASGSVPSRAVSSIRTAPTFTTPTPTSLGNTSQSNPSEPIPATQSIFSVGNVNVGAPPKSNDEREDKTTSSTKAPQATADVSPPQGQPIPTISTTRRYRTRQAVRDAQRSQQTPWSSTTVTRSTRSSTNRGQDPAPRQTRENLGQISLCDIYGEEIEQAVREAKTKGSLPEKFDCYDLLDE